MNSREIFEVIEQIAATSSKTEKEAIIAAYAKDADFVKVLRAALDPFVTYGIKKLPEPRVEGDGYITDDHWVVLYGLAARELTGAAATVGVELVLGTLEPGSRELFKRILLKDLRAGFSESTVNKAIPGLIPTFDCMLAHPYSEHKHKLKFPLYVEPKLDGVRVLTFVTGFDAASVKFFSRSGKEFTTFEHLKEPVQSTVFRWYSAAHHNKTWFDEHGGLVLESEVVSGSFNKTVGEVRRKDEQATDAVLYLFDVLPMSTFSRDDKSGCPLAGEWIMRRLRLTDICTYKKPEFPLILNQAERVESEDDIHRLYEYYRAQGLEGVIVKDPKALYHRRRNHAWSKIKAEESVDIPIIDAIEGTGKYEGMLGALVGDYNGVPVNVGSGFSDRQRSEFWYAWNNPGKATEFDLTRDLLEGRMMEVEFHEVTPDGSLRHPRFKRFRDDKEAA